MLATMSTNIGSADVKLGQKGNQKGWEEEEEVTCSCGLGRNIRIGAVENEGL